MSSRQHNKGIAETVFRHSAKPAPQIAVGNSVAVHSPIKAVPQIAGGRQMEAQRSAKSVLSMRVSNGRKEDKLLFEILGKQVSVFYNDTANTVSFKEGKFTDFDSFSLMVIENSNSKPTIIPRGKCIRIEQSGRLVPGQEANGPLAQKQISKQQTIAGGAKIAAATR